MAKGKIEAITKRIDLGTLIRSRCLSFLHWLNLWTKSRLVPKWKSLPMVDPPLLRNVSRSLDRICKVSKQVATTKVWSLSIFIGSIYISGIDDFRTALHHASNHIKSLSALGRSVPTSPPPSATSSSSNSSQLQPLSSAEVDRQRIDTMSKLTKILQRNLRVRYELNAEELIQA